MLYLFPHIPKTGGAALFANVERDLPHTQVLRLNYSHKQFYHDPRSGNVHFYESEQDLFHLLDSLTQKEKEAIRFASGHDLPYGFHTHFSQPAKYFTFIREPISRTLSLYNYHRYQYDFLKQMKDKDESHRRLELFSKQWFLIEGKIPSFEEWLERSYDGPCHFYWTMSRFLKHFGYFNLQPFFFVGLTETMEEDELFLYSEMGIRTFWANRNASRPYVKLDKRLEAKIYEKNAADFLLYEEAKRINASFKKRRPDFRKRVLQTKVLKMSTLLKEHFPYQKLRKRAKKIVLFLMDRFFSFRKKSPPIPQNPKRILVCNPASFGDVVVSTSLLPVLKKRYPNAEIDFLSSSKTADVLKNHPLISRVHTLNSLREIRSYQYDIAIDLYPHFFLSVLPLLWQAKIPVRIGYFTQGYSQILTHQALPPPTQYIGQTHLELLKLLNIGIRNESPLPFYFSSSLPPKNYIVVHMGTANPLKEWDTEKWIQVIQQLAAQGEIIFLTGKGAREQSRCHYVATQTNAQNLCNRHSWDQFAATIQQAKLLISVDSSAIHLASAARTPCIALFAGLNSIPIWKPPYPKCEALTHPVPCAPCKNSYGCKGMSCIQKITPEQVMKAANQFLKGSFN